MATLLGVAGAVPGRAGLTEGKLGSASGNGYDLNFHFDKADQSIVMTVASWVC